MDPFYITMQRGAERAAEALGVNLEVQIPSDWNVTEQTPILDAMAAAGNLDFLFLAPVDKEAMVAPLENSGLPFLTVDTFIGDGDYVNGPVTAPLSYIGSANEEGGRLACEALIEAIGGSGSIYIQNVLPGISTTDQRQQGCEAAIDASPDVDLVGVDFNDNDPATAAAQTEAALLANTIDGIFGTNVFSAEGAGNVVVNQGCRCQSRGVRRNGSSDRAPTRGCRDPRDCTEAGRHGLPSRDPGVRVSQWHPIDSTESRDRLPTDDPRQRRRPRRRPIHLQ